VGRTLFVRGAKTVSTRPKWKELKLPGWVTDKLPAQGFHNPTPIQIAALQAFQASRKQKDTDFILQDITGSGKTLAYLLPLLTQLDPNEQTLQAVVVLPTRELATQIKLVVDSMDWMNRTRHETGGGKRLRSHAIVGEPNQHMLERLRDQPPQLLIGTAELLHTILFRQDHISYMFSTPDNPVDLQSVNMDYVRFLVMDEVDHLVKKTDPLFLLPFLNARKNREAAAAALADEAGSVTMNGVVFPEDVEDATTAERLNTFLVSATITKEVRELALKHLNDSPTEYITPESGHIRRRRTGRKKHLETEPPKPSLLTDTSHMPVVSMPPQLQHYYYKVEGSMHNRVSALVDILEAIKDQNARVSAAKKTLVKEQQTTLVFFRTWYPFLVELVDELKQRGFKVGTISEHSSRSDRREALKLNKDVILATDVLSRGVDMRHLTHVVNFDFPKGSEAGANVYLHRAGRVGRTGAIRAKSTAANMVFSLCHEVELERLQKVAKRLEFDYARVKLRQARFSFARRQPSYVKASSEEE
jgi:superfamily II DNA/RNA helicase